MYIQKCDCHTIPKVGGKGNVETLLLFTWRDSDKGNVDSRKRDLEYSIYGVWEHDIYSF